MENKFGGAFKGRTAALFLSGKTLLQFEPEDIQTDWITMGVNSTIYHEGLPTLDFLLLGDQGNVKNLSSYVSTPQAYADYEPNISKLYGDFSPMLRDRAADDGAMCVPTRTGDLVLHPLTDSTSCWIEGSSFPMTNTPPFATKGSVAFLALQILALMGFESVHIFGADVDGQRFQDAEGTEPAHKFRTLGMLDTWEQAKVFCADNNLSVFMHRPMALTGMFEDVGTASETASETTLSVIEFPREIKRDPKMRFHVLVPPYVHTNRNFSACAFTQLAINFCEMMVDRDCDIIHYGHPDSVLPDGVAHVDVVTRELWSASYGESNFNHFFEHKENQACHSTYNVNANNAIRSNLSGRDFILPFWGKGNQGAINDIKALVVEPCIGYLHSFADYRIFASHAIENFNLGMNESWPGIHNTVIPHFFNPDHFTYKDREDREDFIFFVGRIGAGKGVDRIINIARTMPDQRFIIAGPGDIKELGDIPDNVQDIGFLTPMKRADYMSRAKACWFPTQYSEPFGMVVVEALMCGSPVICTRHGAFTEIMTPDVGFMGRTDAEFIDALARIDEIDPAKCRERAMDFSYESIGPKYEEHFKYLLTQF
jgi:glycosyltransferase involved in cell wall biosynthesis